MRIREHSIVFQSMDWVKRYDGLYFLKEHSDLFYCIVLVCNLSPWNWGNLKTSLNGRKVKARSLYKACNLGMQTMTLKGTTWEMTCLTFAWFSHKASVSYSICSNLPLHQVIFKCYFKNPWIHREHVNMQLVHMYSTDWVFVRHFGDALLYKDIKKFIY